MTCLFVIIQKKSQNKGRKKIKPYIEGNKKAKVVFWEIYFIPIKMCSPYDKIKNTADNDLTEGVILQIFCFAFV